MQLEDKLVAEHGRILTWMIEGCLDWQRDRLVRPALVSAATEEYFAAQDLFGQWLSDRCEVSALARDFPAHLFASWRSYAVANGEEAGTSREFYDTLDKRGFAAKSSSGHRWRLGLKLASKIGDESDA